MQPQKIVSFSLIYPKVKTSRSKVLQMSEYLALETLTCAELGGLGVACHKHTCEGMFSS